MRRMLLIASVLVCIAGFQVFVLTEHTDRFFAWTIGFPLTAAFLGAGYWAAGLLEYLASRERVWANARPAVPAVWIFTTLTAVATLLHLDAFRTESFWAWAWFAVYFYVPVALGVILILQLRVPGGDPPPSEPLPVWLRGVLVVHVVLMLPLGLGLFIAPASFDGAWPWDLSPLLARAVGAWLIGWSTVKVQMLWENDWRRCRNGFLSTMSWAVLIFVAFGRYGDSVAWNAHLWGFLVAVLSVFVVGLYGVLAGSYGLGRVANPVRGDG
jgi:hypothetical protein